MKIKACIAILLLLLTGCIPGLALAGSAAAPEGDLPASSWFIDMKTYAKGAHGSLSCEQCHPAEQTSLSPNSGKRHPDPPGPDYLKAPARRQYDYRLCQSCHRLAWERFGKGAHAKALAENKTKTLPNGTKVAAPVCADCHDVHYQPSHRDRLQIGRSMTGVCGYCHPAQEATYLDDYHGKAAVNLGNTKAAFCSDCHGAHTSLSLKEQKSAHAACQRCHPQAGPKFATYVVHPTSADLLEGDRDKTFRVWLICLVTAVMAVITVLVVGFFYGHGFVWMLKEIQEKLRKYDHD
jgi:hypothetical protein